MNRFVNMSISKKESNTIAIKEDVVLTMDICRGWTMNSDYIVHYGDTNGFLDVDDDKHIYLVKGQTTGTLEDGGYVGTHGTPLSNVVSLGAVNTEGVGDTYTYYPTYRVPAPPANTYRYLTSFTYGSKVFYIFTEIFKKIFRGLAFQF